MSELSAEEFDKLVKEGLEFAKLRQKFRQNSNPDAGEPGYLISLAWVLNYKKYIFYDKIVRNQTPSISDEIQPHPGKITNSVFLETD